MIYKRPQFVEYMMVRVIVAIVMITLIFSIFLWLFISDIDTALVSISLLWLGFLIFGYVIYIISSNIQNELQSVNKYFNNIEKVGNEDNKNYLFTQDFEDINQSLIKIIKNVKKKEEIKQRYNSKLKLKNRQRGDMISAIAHEFRNPIASIMGYSQTLVEDNDIPPVLQNKFLGKIYNNGMKIESLLSRLVLWNKFESGEASLTPSKFVLYDLVTDVKSQLEEKYTQREIVIKGDSYHINSDRTLLEVVLKNLIENALKYSKDDVIVSISSNKISIIDSGLGILQDDITKVTKKFYRSSSHTWDNSMGLGLSIVKRILDLHGIEIEIQSKENKGSTFSFDISPCIIPKDT